MDILLIPTDTRFLDYCICATCVHESSHANVSYADRYSHGGRQGGMSSDLVNGRTCLEEGSLWRLLTLFFRAVRHFIFKIFAIKIANFLTITARSGVTSFTTWIIWECRGGMLRGVCMH